MVGPTPHGLLNGPLDFFLHSDYLTPMFTPISRSPFRPLSTFNLVAPPIKIFNQSRSLDALRALAGTHPKAAQSFLTKLQAKASEQSLALNEASVAAMRAVTSAQPNQVAEALARANVSSGLQQLFDGTVVQSAGWVAATGAKPLATLRGKARIELDAATGYGSIKVTTVGGREVTVRSHGQTKLTNFPARYAIGLINRSIPVQFRGEWSADGSTLHALEFAPDAPEYGSFTFGRGLKDGRLTLADGRTARFTNSEFFQGTASKLNNWGVILPGGLTGAGANWEYAHNPDSYVTLGRPNPNVKDGAVAAYNTFDGVVDYPDAATRVRESQYLAGNNRNWMIGRFSEFDGSAFRKYIATLVTGATDNLSELGATNTPGTALQTLLWGTELTSADPQ